MRKFLVISLASITILLGNPALAQSQSASGDGAEDGSALAGKIVVTAQ